ncbi:MAG TPA: rod shape-determining protein MreD [Acidimicrobiales bacterium]|nr:rod shape-determining protein MreD [Acidimicrobiales bacterium]
MTAAVGERRFNAVARSRVLLVLFIAVVLQLTLGAGVRMFGVHPDLMLLVAVSGGLVGGDERGAMVGFSAGLMADLFLQAPFGLSAMSFTIIGFAAGMFSGTILRASWPLVLAGAAVASAAGEILYALLGAGLGQSQMVSDRLSPIVGVVAILNGIGALLVVPVMRWAIFPKTDGGVRRRRW